MPGSGRDAGDPGQASGARHGAGQRFLADQIDMPTGTMYWSRNERE
jgi:hypothetical protein